MASQSLRKGMVLAGVLAALLFLVAACSSDGDDGPSYAGGLSGCNHFTNVANDVTLGVLTDEELREKSGEIRTSGSTAEPEIQQASLILLQAATAGNFEAWVAGAEAMLIACQIHGYIERE